MFENLPKLNGIATVEFIIDNSSIIIELDGNNAPITAGNFVDLVARGIYDGVAFHRVIKSPNPFVAQGGDPQSLDPNFPIEQLGGGGFIDPETGERRTIPLEIKLEGDKEPTYNTELGRLAGIEPAPDVVLENDRGAIAMARSTEPDSASSQFYFVLDDAEFLDGDYAVFGSVTEGLDVMDSIEQGDRITDAEVISGIENFQSNRVVTLSVNDISLPEGDEDNTEFIFTVSLNEVNSQTITVDYATADDGAIASEDYTATNGTLEFAPGEIEKTITVQVNGDTEVEDNEVFRLNLSNATNAELDDGTGIATVEDDDDENSQIIELFRFRNTNFDTGTYVFVGEAERDFILNDENLSNTFSLDGVAEDGTVNPAFTASEIERDGLIPFYRIKSLAVPGTFLFVSTAEYEFIFDDPNQQDRWEKEGFDLSGEDVPEFYLLEGSADNEIAFNRFQNRQNGTYLYAGEGETEAIESNSNLDNIFENQGVAFSSLV